MPTTQTDTFRWLAEHISHGAIHPWQQPCPWQHSYLEMEPGLRCCKGTGWFPGIREPNGTLRNVHLEDLIHSGDWGILRDAIDDDGSNTAEELLVHCAEALARAMGMPHD